MPSPSQEHPGLFIRDPYRFSDAMLIIPPPLIECLQCFDGQQTSLDLRASLVKATNNLEVGGLGQHLLDTLSKAGFLEDEQFARMEETRRRDFLVQPVRAPAHAGSAYPDEPEELRATFGRYFADGTHSSPPKSPAPGSAPGSAASGANGRFAVAAPHVSPEGGWQSYRAAYSALSPDLADRTFVILATSHYGTPQRFGLTHKNFETPYGAAQADGRLVDWLAARGGSAIEMEDFCFSFEHTVEFQVVFLQHVFGPRVRILPILCGPFAGSLYRGGNPEDDEGVRHFFDALGELNDRESDRLFWVLGVDMAHMGARYGDPFPAMAGEGEMAAVETRDRQRIDRINACDAAGFWDLVRENQDDLKWCGSSPFYTFLKACPKARGELLHYEQWNIDAQSVVSFAGMAFGK
jgi:AmmeMemoRadiSam system protein B